MLPEDLQRVLWEFAGPWTLKEAMKTCYENVNPNLSPWDVTTVNWKTAFRGPDGDCDVLLSFRFTWKSFQHDPIITLTAEVERECWSGNCMTKAIFDFQTLDSFLEYLPQLDSLLPKGVIQKEPILVMVEDEQDELFYDNDYHMPACIVAMQDFSEFQERWFSPHR